MVGVPGEALRGRRKRKAIETEECEVSVHTNILTERVGTLSERTCQSMCPYDNGDFPASGLSSFSGLKVLKLLESLFIYMFHLYVSENGMHLLTHPGLPGPESGFLLGFAVLAPLPSF